MLTLNFKHIFAKVEKAIKGLESSSNNYQNILVLVDNLNIIMNGCFSKNALDFLEIMNEFTNNITDAH